MTGADGAVAAQGWQDEAFYAALSRAGRSALAWEVLRRDPAHRAIASVERGQGATPDRPLERPLSMTAARAFGLLFRRRS